MRLKTGIRSDKGWWLATRVAWLRPARGRGFLFFPGRRPSSAHGYAQALTGTWDEYERARGESGADRNEFSDAADFVSWYAGKSSIVKKADQAPA